MSKIKAAAYCRYSSDNQREESIDAQIRALTEYASRNNFEIVKVYADEAKSATTDKRPEFLKMIRESEQGLFAAVMVHKLDRFSRDRYDSAHYKRILKKNGVRLISALENIDGSPESIMLESILEGMAEYYSKNLAREVMKGLKENAYKCLHSGGIPPLGYAVSPEKKYIINEKEAEAVRLIFDMTLSGNGYASVANHLNALGYKTKINTDFKVSSIRDILLNEKYTGVYIFNRRASGKKGNYVNKSDHEIIRIEDGIPAIISKEVFNQVNGKMSHRRYGHRSNAKREYLLSGLIKCGNCGGSYTGQGYVGGRGGAKYYIYGCASRANKSGCTNKNIRQDILEEMVIKEINSNLLNNKVMEELSDKVTRLYDSSSDEMTDEIKKATAELASVKGKLSGLLDLLLDGVISKEQYKEKTDGLNDTQEYLEGRLSFIQGVQKKGIKKEDVIKHLLNLRAMLESEDFKHRRYVIETTVQRVDIYDDHLDIFLIVDNLDSGKSGGDEGSRTPVQKHFKASFSERSH